ncbi:MAG: hypothetical protein M5U01_20195 [Ardenticatenaceae bacterium]|nr:hypothetical protein [Ardenticatenaceae bacterium]
MIRGSEQLSERQTHKQARVLARPRPPVEAGSPGLQSLGLGRDRDGLLYVPASYRVARPAPLVLMLHGTGGNARHGLAPLLPLADEAGFILLAPDSRNQTWDIIELEEYGPDIAFVDQALAYTFSRYAVDPAHIAIEGFSDGASYALSVGITNGDLFTHSIAFSPGFMVPGGQAGSPRIFISHGTRDQVLPVDRTSRRIMSQLRRSGYDVFYHEFDGPHTIPPGSVREAVDWFTAERG